MSRYRRALQKAFPDAKIEITNGGHYRLRLPNGRFVIVSATPRSEGAFRNVRRTVRKEMKKGA